MRNGTGLGTLEESPVIQAGNVCKCILAVAVHAQRLDQAREVRWTRQVLGPGVDAVEVGAEAHDACAAHLTNFIDAVDHVLNRGGAAACQKARIEVNADIAVSVNQCAHLVTVQIALYIAEPARIRMRGDRRYGGVLNHIPEAADVQV